MAAAGSQVLKPDAPVSLANYLMGEADSYEKEQAQNARVFAVAYAVLKMHQVRYVVPTGRFYYYNEAEDLYRPLSDRQLDTWVADLWLGHLPALGAFTDKLADSAARTFKKLTTHEKGCDMNYVPRDVIRIADSLYWDAEAGDLATAPPPGGVFYRLFDSPRPTRHTTVIPPLTPPQVALLRDAYDSAVAYLEGHDGDLPETFDFVTTWARGDHTIYLDIMRVSGYCFLKKKPTGAVLLIGPTRNGKSSYTGLMHTIFGTRNTSRVKMSEIGDPHNVEPLTTTLFNAPDEVDKRPVQHTDFLKTITDHGSADFPVMRSGQPVEIEGDFMCFFPLNHVPKWGDTESAALVNRSMVIPFRASLRSSDNDPRTFEERTYTPETVCRFLGTILAVAHYYTIHPIAISDSMIDEQTKLAQGANSAELYIPEFERFFDGFTTWKFIYQDYLNWCNTKEIKYASQSDFEWTFREYSDKKAQKRIDIGGQRVRVKQVPKSGHHILRPDFCPQEFKLKIYDKTLEGHTVNQLHDMGGSMVYLLNDAYEQEREAMAEQPAPLLFNDEPADGFEDEIFKEE